MLNKLTNIVGLIPAAGYANRISPIPCSKEIFPINFSNSARDDLSRPKVVSSYLLDSFRTASIDRTYMIIREGKWDIPEYFLGGEDFGMNLSYLVTDPTPGTPFTVDKAYSFVKNSRVIFGFPDILFRPVNAFIDLLEKQQKTGSDVVLGLFPADNPQKVDMVEVADNGEVKNIITKPAETDLSLTWIITVWTPRFTEFMHDFLSGSNNNVSDKQGELYMGNVIQSAIDNGLKVTSVTFPEGFYIDIGTADDLEKVIEMKLTS